MGLPRLLDANGRPLPRAARKKTDSRNCPRCGAGPEKRIASSGLGVAHPICNGGCSPVHEWLDEVWRD